MAARVTSTSKGTNKLQLCWPLIHLSSMGERRKQHKVQWEQRPGGRKGVGGGGKLGVGTSGW